MFARLLIPLCAALVLNGCDNSLFSSDIAAERKQLLREAKDFSIRNGFKETTNFIDYSEEQKAYSICGVASKWYLPYSGTDPAIWFFYDLSEKECSAINGEVDVDFYAVEAFAGSRAPLTPTILQTDVPRFLYLIFHEDCHEQFSFPLEIEEALCEATAYTMMESFGKEKFGHRSKQYSEIIGRIRRGKSMAQLTNSFYKKLDGLYDMFYQKQIGAEELLEQRAKIYAEIRKNMKVNLNNIHIAIWMLYTKNFDLIDGVIKGFGGNIKESVEFFRHIDEIKPAAPQNLDVAAIRAYEAEIIEIIKKENGRLR